MTLRHPVRHRSRPRLEALERRDLLAATLVLDGPQTLVPSANVNVSNNASTIESEMTIDVNPANPLNVAGFAHSAGSLNEIQVFWSMDGGNTWTRTWIRNVGTVNNDGQGSGIRFDPTIKFDAQGNLYVAYGAYTGSTTKMMVGKSIDGGATFENSAFRVLDAQSGYGGVDKFYLAVGPAGPGSTSQAIYLAYTQAFSRIVVTGSNDAGETFTAPLVLESPGGGNFYAGPSVGPNGELYVAWLDVASRRIKLRVDPDGLWEPAPFNPLTTVRTLTVGMAQALIPAQPRRGIYNNPSIDVDRSGGPYHGRAYIGWVDRVSGIANNMDIFLAWSDDQGATWTSPGLAGNVEDASSSDFHSWVSVDQSSGSVNVLYYTTDGDQDDGNNDVVVRVASSLDGGATFTKVDLSSQRARASAASYVGDFLDYIGMAVHHGTIHGFWSDNRGATPGTFRADLDSYSARACFQSETASNTLNVRGDDAGATDDLILVRLSATNGEYLEVEVNGQLQYAGLACSVNVVAIQGLEGNDIIQIGGGLDWLVVVAEGGEGDDLIVGGGAYGFLDGGAGRNILIAGLATSQLAGGSGEDLLIGGITAYDQDLTALTAIMAEWRRDDISQTERFIHLTEGGGLSDPYLLTPDTVFGNGMGNLLFGGEGLDIFFGNFDLDVYDWEPGVETFIPI